MKKTRHLILSAVLVIICTFLTVTAAALRVGEVIDYVLATDIRAFIDGSEIKAYNIGGRLGVIAEDLCDYGFTVVWNGESRTLSITRNENPTVEPMLFEEKQVKNVGAMTSAVLYTDIVTYLDGNVVESFNINGETIIYFSELARYGSCLYDDNARLSMISSLGSAFDTVTLDEIPKEIVHAGGAIDGVVGTNSLEALDESYEKGYRFLELDFLLSSDGIPVCLHDWSAFYSSSLGSTPITAEEFSKVKIYNRFTSVTIDSLCEWLKTHPDAYIITDVKDDNVTALRTIAWDHPEIVSRLIPQIYQYGEYAPVRALGYSNIILTLYCLPKYEQKIDSAYNAAFAKKHRLLGVTADITLVKENFAEAYLSEGVPLFVHTVNDKAKKQALYEKGISCIYTDFAE